ncbi:MFS general substrate transporter [Bimuria novae-zelandiae CBS 107.79]|uniref:MFS general substrate transporter n=1 Tax=Bimuria novae-zelandiae CBS 107.79 TaxID=1447943 RepID=A0A6A5VEL5_9PLEO|nr:MFS general substrate transporter [Bimuria novae-zelandiae CBS 107.79]
MTSTEKSIQATEVPDQGISIARNDDSTTLCSDPCDTQQAVSYLEASSDAQDGNGVVYLTGVRLWLINTSIALTIFLTNLEVSVVTTSLVAITTDFGGFDSIGWIVSSYLLGYVAVLVIFAKLSDIFGRKLMFSTSIAIFMCFSAGCGAAQSLTQL